ncbi:hypothetical protein [Kitasatospora griseola]|uniref:hypothetical protein n=1 Tax=Kitasatospora griseola TaxID=2064 RepID=UPI0016701920|nr:hypothetical protein [Kitasatospora griseola]GGQ59062.1 hypothetical protein GCM10010195_13310 [Kitasatospora griseola]
MIDDRTPWWLRARYCLLLVALGWMSTMLALFLDDEVNRLVTHHLFSPRPPLAAAALVLNLVAPGWAVAQLCTVLRRKHRPVGIGHMALTAVLPMAVLAALAELAFLWAAVGLHG